MVLRSRQAFHRKATARLVAVRGRAQIDEAGLVFIAGAANWHAIETSVFRLLQFGILDLGFVLDSDARIGIAPQREKRLESSVSPYFVAR